MQHEYGNLEPRQHEDDPRASKMEGLLSQLEQIVIQGRQVPFSSQRIVDPNEILLIVGQLRDQLPAELRQARWILDHNQRTVDDARLEAERLMRAAETRIAEMIDEHEITMRAQAYAEDTVLAAEESAQKIMEQGTSYLESHMIGLEERLLDILHQLRQDRQELHRSDF